MQVQHLIQFTRRQIIIQVDCIYQTEIIQNSMATHQKNKEMLKKFLLKLEKDKLNKKKKNEDSK